jgi:SNF2 family DNA or RNA helicase
VADELGLGKTIEAGWVITQRWAEQRRPVLLIVPASLRKQWTQELQSKFSIPADILESKSYRERKKTGVGTSFEVPGKVVVTSYEFAARQAACLWVNQANKVAAEMGKKQWRYLLIPHDAVTGSSTLSGLAGKWEQTVSV